MIGFPSFLSWIILYCMYIHISPMGIWISSTFWLLWTLLCCCEHGFANVSLSPCFQFFWICTKKWDIWVLMIVLFLVFWGTSLMSHQQLYYIKILPVVQKASYFCVPCPTLVIFCSFFKSSHPNGCELPVPFYYFRHPSRWEVVGISLWFWFAFP